MPKYEVYATRFDSLGIVEELVPARDLSFSLPLSDHGECSFSATVEPGRTLWRAALALPFSGVMITRDRVPIWEGVVIDDQESGPRSFSFTAREWGWVFEEETPPVPRNWFGVNDHQIFRDLVNDAQGVAGQNLLVQTGSTLGATASDKTDVTTYAKTTVGREFRAIADAEGGPEWYFGVAGTLDAPKRQLVLGDRLGHAEAQAVLEYVEDTVPADVYPPPPTVTLLGDLFPASMPQVPTKRAGGNVIAKKRSRSRAGAATVVVATGDGQDAAQLKSTATASTLLAQGWPRITQASDYSDVRLQETLDRRAEADLAARAGISTEYSLVTLDGDETADWSQTPRGSTVKVILDTDIYGAQRPVGGPSGFDTRCYNVTVRVPDAGPAQVEWFTATALEVQ